MLILSAVQFKPELARSQADVRLNFKKCAPLIDAAWRVGSHLIVFPELFLTGYSFLSKQEAFLASERHDGPTFRAMRSLAIDLKSYIAYGYLEADGDKFYNSGTLINPDGIAEIKCRKVNLWGPDFLWATPGSEAPPVIETDFGTLSMVICRDLRSRIPSNIPRVSSDVHFFDEDKPEFLALCSNWGKGGFTPTTWMDYTTNNQCTLIASNRYGLETNAGHELDFGSGGTAIIQPNWAVHTDGLKFNQDCVVSVALEES